ncbi:MAG TPA: phosphatase PAP2 family protein [Lacipirellulaceae bacterium]|nr:phosphatase PAP2 family protein [Lacipirellulaceae bacterium]
MLAVIILVALAPCDITVARLSYAYEPPRFVIHLLEILQNVGGNGFAVAVLILAAVYLSRTKLSRVPLLVSIALGGGLLADTVKMCVSRTRPHSTDLATATFFSTFHGLLPFLSAHSGGQSFPSGHAATAIGFAVAMSLIYPRGRWFFGLLAVTVAAIRIIVHAHYLTDVTAGLMLGGTSAFVCYRGFAAPAFAWCERSIDLRLARWSDSRIAHSDAMCKPEDSLPSSESVLINHSHTRDAA